MFKPWLTSILIAFSFTVVFSFGVTNSVQGQDDNNDDVEVYLDFRHRGIVSTVVISYYKDDQFYLPITELFSLFSLDYEVNGMIISGDFGVEQTPYTIDFKKNIIKFGDQTTTLTPNDYLIKELDSYLRSDLFYEVFDLDFSIDFNNLSLKLVTERELPAIQQAIRSQRRQLANTNRFQDQKYELRYDREKPFIDGGFFDYNLSANLNQNNYGFNYNANLGLQVYGGDLQGQVFGNYSDGFSNLATNNLRWRYMFRDQEWLTKLQIGQTTTDGFTQNRYTGIRISNEPIEPRRLFDEYEIQGSTIPQSEVELYLNNSLIDFATANELGNYRFLAPITYGSTQLDLRIYGPTGQIIQRSERIQVPFTFQPKGKFNYSANAGRLDNAVIGETSQKYTAQAHGSYGITDWLTAKTGVEYYQGYHTSLPTFTSSLSSRILNNYIVTLEAANNVYYRGNLNVIYPNSASINFDYTNFISSSSIYNNTNDDQRVVASAFYPFNFFGVPFNIRVSGFSRFRASTTVTTFRTDVNTRISNINLRIGYRDRLVDTFNPLDMSSTSTIQSSLTYNFSRNRYLPSFLRGVFLRAAMGYRPTSKQFETAEVLISKNILKTGRLQLSAGKNFIGNFNTLRFSLIFDLGSKVRSSTTFNSIRGSSNVTQNIRGSVGYDPNYNNFIFTNRDQVGRAATAIQLYVDSNVNGAFDEEDEIIEEKAVRVLRSGANSTLKNGVLYLTQMQPYYYYNMEMNKSAIKNPMLVPEFEKFGLITDPNRFKKVEIPFYMSGVIDGTVQRLRGDSSKTGIGGLKLRLSDSNGDFAKELRTFSDGSFYEWEVPPGTYELQVDAGNLQQLNSKSIPEKLEFEVKAVPEGDFVEGLSLLLVPLDYEEPEEEVSPITMEAIPSSIKTDEEMLALETELSEGVNDVLRLIIEAQNAFYNKNISRAMDLVDQSLDIFETAQAYALKGSLSYLRNDKENARKYWNLAKKYDPDIYIPNEEYLDQMIVSEPLNSPK
ncbi:MAG: hypothetical protein CL666_05845 [Balneola sp.]|nr:hypothetical protein [Balneola sp.]